MNEVTHEHPTTFFSSAPLPRTTPRGPRMSSNAPRRGLGRGLGSLIPTAPSQPLPPPAAADPASSSAGPNEPATPAAAVVGRVAGRGRHRRRRLLRRAAHRAGPSERPPAAAGLRGGGARRAGALDPGGRPPAARRRTPHRRGRVRADHGRASLARLPAGRPRHDPRDRARDRRRRHAPRRAAGEPPPLAAQPARGGGRLRPAARGLRLHPRGARPAHRPLAAADLQHAAAAEAVPRRPASRRCRRPLGRARPRPPVRRRRRSPGQARGPGHGGGHLRARTGGDRLAAAPRRSRLRASCAGSPSPPVSTSWENVSPTGSRPASRSTSARPRARSPSSSPASTTCAGSSTSWTRATATTARSESTRRGPLAATAERSERSRASIPVVGAARLLRRGSCCADGASLVRLPRLDARCSHARANNVDKATHRPVDEPTCRSSALSSSRASRRACGRAPASPRRRGGRPPRAWGRSRPSRPAPTTSREAARRRGSRRSCRASICDIWAWRRAVSPTGSSPVGCIGSPTVMAMVLPREKSRGWSLVIIRCVPHRMTGTTGTPASAAMRTAPVLNSLSSMAREMVASGKMPTASPRRRWSTAAWKLAIALAAVDLDVVQRAHQRADRPVVEQLALGHEPDQPAGRVGREAAVDEVDVADVVVGQQHATLARHVLGAAHPEALAEGLEGRLGGDDDRRVGHIAHGEEPRVSRPVAATLRDQRRVARKSAIRPIASSRTDASGSVTSLKWSVSGQLKPVPCVTRIFLARRSSMTKSWSSSMA